MFSKSNSMYSSLTLILAICEGSCDSPRNKFSSFLILHIVPHTSKASGICEKNFKDFLGKIYERTMKNPFSKNSQGTSLKARGLIFWILALYIPFGKNALSFSV